LRRAETRQELTGLPITRGGTRISHLLVADDSLLFFKANIREWHTTQQLLDEYEQVSGQRLNLEKTSLFFSRNTLQETRDFIISVAGVNTTNSYEKWDFLPLLVDHVKELSSISKEELKIN
jgi:hypothetical protein